MGARSVVLSVAFVGLAAVSLLVSFVSWFRVDVLGHFDQSGTYPIRHSVDAWQGSSLWAAAVLLAVLAALCGLVMVRLPSRRATALIGGVGIAAVAGSAVAWGRQWWLITHPPRPSLAVAERLGAFDHGPVSFWPLLLTIKKNDLADYAAYNRAGWHAYQTVGAALMIVLLVATAGLLVWMWLMPSESRARALSEVPAG